VHDSVVDKAYACLVGGLIGDAMGTLTENLEPDEIDQAFGWVGDFEDDGTDDSIMKYFLCDALIETHGYATADDWAAQWVRQREDIFGAKQDRFFVSVLHTAEKLVYGHLPRTVSQGNMPSSSSAMAIAPVGIVNAFNPRSASAQAQEIASLIHTGDVGFCQDAAAAVAAAVAAGFHPNASIGSVMDAALAHLKPSSGRGMLTLIQDALVLAQSNGSYVGFRDAYHKRFRQVVACDSRETAPAALALCYLADGDPARALPYAANFGRDTDTIGTMAGAICGAWEDRQASPMNGETRWTVWPPATRWRSVGLSSARPARKHGWRQRAGNNFNRRSHETSRGLVGKVPASEPALWNRACIYMVAR